MVGTEGGRWSGGDDDDVLARALASHEMERMSQTDDMHTVSSSRPGGNIMDDNLTHQDACNRRPLDYKKGGPGGSGMLQDLEVLSVVVWMKTEIGEQETTRQRLMVRVLAMGQFLIGIAAVGAEKDEIDYFVAGAGVVGGVESDSDDDSSRGRSRTRTRGMGDHPDRLAINSRTSDALPSIDDRGLDRSYGLPHRPKEPRLRTIYESGENIALVGAMTRAEAHLYTDLLLRQTATI